MKNSSSLSTHSRRQVRSLAAGRLFSYLFLLFCCTLSAVLVVADRSFVTFMRDVPQTQRKEDCELKFEEDATTLPSSIAEFLPEVCLDIDYGACLEGYETEADDGAQDLASPSSVYEFSEKSIFGSHHQRSTDVWNEVVHAAKTQPDSARQLLFEFSSLPDISPPGMWPPQDDTPPPSRRYLRDKNEEVHPPETHASYIRHSSESNQVGPSGDLFQQPFSQILTSHLPNNSPPEMWLELDADSDDVNFSGDHQPLRSDASEMFELRLDMLSESSHNYAEETVLYEPGPRAVPAMLRDDSRHGQLLNNAGAKDHLREHGRALLADMRDISPPGLWPDDDSDDESFHETRRTLLSDLRQISPPGIWRDDDSDDESFHEYRRSLLSDLRDISPPGIWQDDDSDDESLYEPRRTLLLELRDISPPDIWMDDDSRDEGLQEPRRVLLSNLRDISPPGIWGDDDSDDESIHKHKRTLLSDPSDFSHPDSRAGHDSDGGSLRQQRRNPISKFRDISRAEKWQRMGYVAERLLRGRHSSHEVHNNLCSTINSGDERRSNVQEDGRGIDSGGISQAQGSSSKSCIPDVHEAGIDHAADVDEILDQERKISPSPFLLVSAARRFSSDLMRGLRRIVLHSVRARAAGGFDGEFNDRQTKAKNPRLATTEELVLVEREGGAAAGSLDLSEASIISRPFMQLSLQKEGAPVPAHSFKPQRLTFPDLLALH